MMKVWICHPPRMSDVEEVFNTREKATEWVKNQGVTDRNEPAGWFEECEVK